MSDWLLGFKRMEFRSDRRHNYSCVHVTYCVLLFITFSFTSLIHLSSLPTSPSLVQCTSESHSITNLSLFTLLLWRRLCLSKRLTRSCSLSETQQANATNLSCSFTSISISQLLFRCSSDYIRKSDDGNISNGIRFLVFH